MKKILVLFSSLLTAGWVHSATVGDVTVVGKVIVNEIHASTVGKVASIWFIDGSTLNTGSGSGGGGGGGSLVYFDGSQFISLSTVSMVGIKSASLTGGTSFFFFESTGNWTASQRFLSSSTFAGAVTLLVPISSLTVNGKLVVVSSLSVLGVVTSTSGFIGGGSSFTYVSLEGGNSDRSSLSLAGTPNTGILSVGANTVGVQTAGAIRGFFNSAGLTISNGDYYDQGGVQTAPSYSFTGQTNSGMWLSLSPPELAFSQNGIALLRVGLDYVRTLSSFTAADVITSSMGFIGGGSTFTFISVSGSSIGVETYNLVFATPPTAGQHLFVSQMNGNNAIIAGGGDNAGSGSGSDSGDAFGNPISTRPITAPRGIEISSGTVFSTMNVYGLIQSTSGALLGGSTVQGVFTLEGGSLAINNPGIATFTLNFASAPTAGQHLGVTGVAGSRLTIGGVGDLAGSGGAGSDSGDAFGNPASTQIVVAPFGINTSSGFFSSSVTVSDIFVASRPLLGAATIQGMLTVEGGSFSFTNPSLGTSFQFNYASAPTAGQKLGVTGVAGNRVTIGGVGDNSGTAQPTITVSTVAGIHHINIPVVSMIAMSTAFATAESTTMYRNPNPLVNFMPRAFDQSTTEYVYGTFLIPTNIDMSSSVVFTVSLMAKTPSATQNNVQVVFESTAILNSSAYNYTNSTGVDICNTGTLNSETRTCTFTQSVTGLTWMPNETVFYRLGRGHDTSKLTDTELRADLYMLNLMIDIPTSETAISQGDNLGNGRATVDVDMGGNFGVRRSTGYGLGPSNIPVVYSTWSPQAYSGFGIVSTTGTIAPNTTITITAASLGLSALGVQVCSELEITNTATVSVRVKSMTSLPTSFDVFNADAINIKGFTCIGAGKP